MPDHSHKALWPLYLGCWCWRLCWLGPSCRPMKAVRRFPRILPCAPGGTALAAPLLAIGLCARGAAHRTNGPRRTLDARWRFPRECWWSGVGICRRCMRLPRSMSGLCCSRRAFWQWLGIWLLGFAARSRGRCGGSDNGVFSYLWPHMNACSAFCWCLAPKLNFTRRALPLALLAFEQIEESSVFGGNSYGQVGALLSYRPGTWSRARACWIDQRLFWWDRSAGPPSGRPGT